MENKMLVNNCCLLYLPAAHTVKNLALCKTEEHKTVKYILVHYHVYIFSVSGETAFAGIRVLQGRKLPCFLNIICHAS
jgi:hypothetical protein